MKIFFITHYTDLYGANKSLLNLIEGLTSFGITSIVLSPFNGKIVDECKKRKIQYLIIPFVSSFCSINDKENFRFIRRLKYLLPIFKAVLKIRPDIIYSNTSVIDVGIISAFILRIPHVWHIREFGKLDYNVKYDLGEKVFRFWLNKSTVIIAISQLIREKVLLNVKILNQVIYNGVFLKNHIKSHRRFPNVNPLRLFCFAIIGLLSPNKGQIDAIKAFFKFNNIFPNAILLIAGNGTEEYTNFLKKTVNRLDLNSKIKFLGYIKNIQEVYTKTDVLLMCSGNEAMGRVTVEAMANGIPVIGRNSGATPEIIQYGRNGLLYDNDYNDLSEKMKFLFQNPQQYEKYSKAGIQTVKDYFTIEKYAENVYKVLNKIR